MKFLEFSLTEKSFLKWGGPLIILKVIPSQDYQRYFLSIVFTKIILCHQSLQKSF